MVKELVSYADVSGLIASGLEDFQDYGRVHSVVHGNLIKLNYGASVIYDGDWNWLELHSRGHIYNRRTGKLVALPFDKFFNYGEGGRYPDSRATLVDVTEKIDGSLGIGYFEDGLWKISTVGAFESEQAIWATRFLHEQYPGISRLPSFLTPLFEIVYPENYQVSELVVNYGDVEELYLIGLRNTIDLSDYFWGDVADIAARIGLEMPCIWQFENIDEVLLSRNILTDNEEGFVVRMSDGTRFKIKGEKYLRAHKLISNFSKKAVFEMFSKDMESHALCGEIPVGTFLSGGYFQVPNEDYPVHEKQVEECRKMLMAFSQEFLNFISSVFSAYSRVADIESRAEFAKAVMDFHDNTAPLMFDLRDGKLVRFISHALSQMQKDGEIGC